MSGGTWFAMCPSSKAVELDALMKQVGWLGNEKPKLEGGRLVVAVRDDDTGKSGTLMVHLSKDASVVKEAAEFAESYGADRPDREQIATYDARYELTWKQADAGTVYDTVLLVTGKLKRLCGAVIFNSGDREFV